MLEKMLKVFRRDQKDEGEKMLQLFLEHQKMFTTVSNIDAAFKMGLPKAFSETNMAVAYSEVVWVHVAVKAILESAAMLPLKIYQNVRGKKGMEKKEVLNGFTYDLLNRPSEFMTPVEFKQTMFGSFAFSGNCFLYVDTTDKQLLILKPQDVKIIPSKEKFIDSYIFEPSWGERTYMDPHQVVHVKTFHTYNYFYGLSPLQAAWRSINFQDKEADFWNIFWKEGGRVQGAFTVDAPLSKENKDYLIESLKKEYGGVKKMQRNLILDNGMKYQQLGVSQKDAQIIDKFKLTREDILAVYCVPPSIAGILEQANYSNMEVQERIFYKRGILPILRLFEEALGANQLLSNNGQFSFCFDLSDIDCLKQNEELKAKIGKILIESGQHTQNEVREDLWEKPPIPGGDELRSVNNIPLAPSVDATLNELPKLMAELKEIDQQLLALPEVNVPKKPLKKPYTMEMRDALAKEFDAELESHDREVTKAMKQVFDFQKRLVLDNVKSELKNRGEVKLQHSDVSNLLLGFHDTQFKAQKLLQDAYPPIMKRFGERAAKQLDKAKSKKSFAEYSTKKATPFNFNDPRIAEFIQKRSVKIAGLTTETTQNELRVGISDVIATDGTIKDVVDFIESYFDGVSKARATTIARTETAAAANESIDLTWRQNADVVKGREWITSRDDRVRDSHLIDGQAAHLGDPFILANGNVLMYPGESGGDAGDVINCRCTTAPILDFESPDAGVIEIDVGS